MNSATSAHILLKHQKMRGRTRRRQRASLWSVLLIILFVASLVFTVWSRLQITYLGYQLSQLNNEHTQLLKLNKQLRLEVASLESLSRIENIARNQLGLITPKPDQIIFIQ